MREAVIRVAAVVLLAAVSMGHADTLSVPIRSPIYINGVIHDQDRERALVRIPIPDEVRDAKIHFAMICFPGFTTSGPVSRITLEARRVTTSWSPDDVNWSSPWQTPGGDFDTLELFQYVIGGVPDERPVLDITGWVNQWQQGAGAFGVVLMRPRAEGGGFGTEREMLREHLPAARVKYYYTRIAR